MKKHFKNYWNLYHDLSDIILEGLQGFYKMKRSGYPAHLQSLKQWNSILKEMIYAFEKIKECDGDIWVLKKQQQQKVNRGLELFRTHLFSLWD